MDLPYNICGRCNEYVSSYTHSFEWLLQDSSRYKSWETVELSCGCVIMGADFDFDDEISVILYDPLTGDQVLRFEDMINMAWEGEEE